MELESLYEFQHYRYSNEHFLVVPTVTFVFPALINFWNLSKLSFREFVVISHCLVASSLLKFRC